MEVGAVGLGTGDHPEEEVIAIEFHDGEEGGNWRSAGGDWYGSHEIDG